MMRFDRKLRTGARKSFVISDRWRGFHLQMQNNNNSRSKLAPTVELPECGSVHEASLLHLCLLVARPAFICGEAVWVW